MIAWFGPAVLLVLLAASNMPDAAAHGSSAAAAVLVEEFGIAVACYDGVQLQVAPVITAVVTVALPRELPRNRTVRGHGLPAPRAPTR